MMSRREWYQKGYQQAIKDIEKRSCENCKHLQNYHESNEISCDMLCGFYQEDFYCKYWEKKDANKNTK